MFKASIKTGNAAFRDSESKEYDEYARQKETARILRQIASALECGANRGNCTDYNGNVVGEWHLNSR